MLDSCLVKVLHSLDHLNCYYQLLFERVEFTLLYRVAQAVLILIVNKTKIKGILCDIMYCEPFSLEEMIVLETHI